MKISYIVEVFFIIAITLTNAADCSKEIVKTFTDQKVQAFNHLVVNKNDGWLFVGAVNHLYHLSSDLDLIKTEMTGPKRNPDKCSILDCNNTTLTDNVNKILLIDYTKAKLITCGTSSLGTCSVRGLNNITNNLEVKTPVVANKATSSTVAFIAPGPSTSPSQVMHVGVTLTSDMVNRFEMPAVSSRSLDSSNMFSIASTEENRGTRIFVSSLYRDRYPITYVYGFASEGFSYFLTTQLKNTTSNEFISKLVRVCQKDEYFSSYTEIPIDCKMNVKEEKSYNLVQAAYIGKAGADLASDLGVTRQDDVLFTVFSKNELNSKSTPSQSSAVCVYSLKAIRRTFTQIIQDCMNGKGELGLDFISPSMQCIPTMFNNISEDFCGVDINTPLGGKQPISAVPVLSYNTRLTAIAATSVGNATVAFIGTSTGHLKKVLVQSSTTGFQYEDLVVDEGFPINPDLLFDTENKYIYAMTEKKISKIKVESCSVYQTCSECLGTKDPYCSWCPLQLKCTSQPICRNSVKNPVCATITSVSPNKVQKGKSQELALTIDNFPKLQKELWCAFTASNVTLITKAMSTAHGVNCMTPKYDLLPSLPYGQNELNVTLSVRESDSSDFAATNFLFYDCNSYSSCTQCVSSRYPCTWCIDRYRCTHNATENCRNGILIPGKEAVGPSYRKGSDLCPAINDSWSSTSELLVTEGTKKSIKVKVNIVEPFIIQSRIGCQFNIEGRVKSVNAFFLGDTVYCEKMIFSYASRAPYANASFAVIWGGSIPLDNPNKIYIQIYNCQKAADNCGMCLIKDKKYNCGWCPSSNSCELREHCDEETKWLNRNQTCPNPQIISFKPKLGPWEGGTYITIEGINLGKDFRDIQSGIKIAGINCLPIEHLYVKTKQVTCQVDSPGTKTLIQGPVTLQIEHYRTESLLPYKFVNPVVSDFSPKSGPKSGGTKILITGEYLNAGNNVQVFLDDVPCRIIFTELTRIECLSGETNSTTKKRLKLKFDNAERWVENMLFEYVEDPIIHSVESDMCDGTKQVRGIPAGRQQITVIGTNLKFIQKSEILVYYNMSMYAGVCNILNDTSMSCLSPVIDTFQHVQIDEDNPLKLKYGFRLDNVVKNVTRHGFDAYLLYSNPEFIPFERGIKHYKSDYLTITGNNIDLLCPEKDITVKVGENICNITSISRHQLTCRPPQIKSLADSEPKSGAQYEVVIYVGQYQKYNIGVLLYSTPPDEIDHQQRSLEEYNRALIFLEKEYKAKMALLKRRYETDIGIVQDEWELKKQMLIAKYLPKM